MHHEGEQHAQCVRDANRHQRPGNRAEPAVDEVARSLRAGRENPEPDDGVDASNHQERHALVVDEPDQRARRRRFGRQVEARTDGPSRSTRPRDDGRVVAYPWT